MQTPSDRQRNGHQRVRTFTVTSRRIASRYPGGAEDRVPLLRLSGHWLERCGFATDAIAAVKVRQGRIVITILQPAPAPVQPAKSLQIAEPPKRRAAPRPRLKAMRRTLRRCAAEHSAGARPLLAARTVALRAALRAELDVR
jgi:hypothetical protein